MTRQPPRLASFLLRLRFPRKSSEFLLGDLIEEYNAGNQSDQWYWRQTLGLLWSKPVDRTVESERTSLTNLLHSIWTDLHYAVRLLGASPGMTIGAVLALALGIGVSTGIFTLLNAIALRPLAVPDASRVASIYQTFQGPLSRDANGALSMFSYEEYLQYRDNNHVFSGLLAYRPLFRASLGGEQPRRVQGQLVSCNYFDVLEVRPNIGPGLTDENCAASGKTSVVVLGDSLWRSAFHADPAVLGKVISLNRVPLTVVAIAPPGFRGTEPYAVDFWAPLAMQPALEPGNENFLVNDRLSWLVALGRLKEGMSLANARAGLAVISARMDQRHPEHKTALVVESASLFDEPQARGFLIVAGAVILAAVSLVLLIACANVANLLLARASARRKEIAIRLSIGAGRGRLIRQLMTESLLLALIGGALGSALAFWSCDALFQLIIARIPANMPTIALSISPDLRALGYALALTVITSIGFGLAPALQASKLDLNTALKEESSGLGASGSRSWLRSALVVAQVSICLVLLLTAGLLARGLRKAQTIDPGFTAEGVSVVSMDLDQQGYDTLKATIFRQKLIERISAMQSVDAVAQTAVVPLSVVTWGSGIKVDGGNRAQAHFDKVSPTYFPLLAIPIVRGRNFTEAEARSGEQIAIVTEATARRLWPNQDPLGKVFQFQGRDTWNSIRVVGVAKNARTSSLGADDEYFCFFPTAPEDQVGLHLLVHSGSSFAATSKGIREAVYSLDPNILTDIHPLRDNVNTYRLPSQIGTILSSALGALALLLASIGIYSVVAYVVSQRTREIGVRMSLGADASDILRLVLRGSMRPVLLGVFIGVAGCAAVSRILTGLLFGISPLDPVTFVAVPTFLIAVALLASYLPARRASRVDPTTALRYE